MASSPRLRGADTYLYVKTETTIGTAATGNFVQVPFFECTVGATAPLQEDPALSATAEITRDSTGVYLGKSVVGGQVVVPVDLESFGVWLRLLMGAPTTAGTTDYTHTFVSGLQTGLPAATMEKAFPRISRYSLLTGVQANTLSFSAGTDQRPRATLGMLGRREVISSSSGAGTPTFAGLSGFQQRQYSLQMDGSALGNCTAFTLNYANGMEPYNSLNSGDAVEAIEEGPATCSGSFTVRVSQDAVTLINNALTETAHSLLLKLEASPTQLIQFTAHNVILDRPTIGISGPGGVDVSFNFIARYDATGGEMLEAILKNQTATYA